MRQSAQLVRHYSERQICEIVWLVASEHLYNVSNIGLNIGSDGLCEVRPKPVTTGLTSGPPASGKKAPVTSP